MKKCEPNDEHIIRYPSTLLSMFSGKAGFSDCLFSFSLSLSVFHRPKWYSLSCCALELFSTKCIIRDSTILVYVKRVSCSLSLSLVLFLFLCQVLKNGMVSLSPVVNWECLSLYLPQSFTCLSLCVLFAIHRDHD